MKRVLYIILFAFIAYSVSSCRLTRTEMNEPSCPVPPEKICQPDKFDPSMDTSDYATMIRSAGYVLRELNLNTPSNNEWQLTFNGDNAYLTQDSANIQHIAKYDMETADEFNFIENIDCESGLHIGTIKFSGNEIFCAAGETSNLNPYRQIKIYNSSLNQNIIHLGDQVKFGNKTLSDKWVSQPAFSPDGKFMFFVCDDDSGYGGTDIFYAVKVNDGWGKPINCGSIVNTACDELSPFISKNGDFLYFASEGHETLGGYDLFRSKINYEGDNLKFSQPQNLLEPINTQFNELFAESPSDPDSLLYFSSDRKGSFDIYVMVSPGSLTKFRMKKDFHVKHKPPKSLELKKPETVNDTKTKIDKIAIIDSTNSFLLKGKVFSARTRLPLDSAEINIEWHDSLKTESSNKTGAFSVRLNRGNPYEISVHKQYYSYDKYFFNSDSVPAGGVVNHDFYLPEYAVIRINFPFDNFTDPYQFTLDSNGAETNVTWDKELDIAAQDILASLDKIDKIVLVGHTDDQGTKEYNIGLGTRRVTFVIDELVKRGVPRNIMVSRSAGKGEPLPKKAGEDIENYRKRLRRVVLEKFYK